MRHHMVSALLATVELLHAIHSLWITLLPFATLWWSTMLYATCAKYFSWNRSQYRRQIAAGCSSFQEMPILLGACNEPLKLGDDASSYLEKEVDTCLDMSPRSQVVEDMCLDVSSDEEGASMSYIMEPDTRTGATFPIQIASPSIQSQKAGFSLTELSSLHLSGARWQRRHLPSLTTSQWRACFDLSGFAIQMGLSIVDHPCDQWLVRGSSVRDSDLLWLKPTMLKESSFTGVNYDFTGLFYNYLVEGVWFTNANRGHKSDLLTGKKAPSTEWYLCRQSENYENRLLTISISASPVLQGLMIDSESPFMKHQSGSATIIDKIQPSVIQRCNGDQNRAPHGADGIRSVSDGFMHYDTSYDMLGKAGMDSSRFSEDTEGYGNGDDGIEDSEGYGNGDDGIEDSDGLYGINFHVEGGVLMACHGQHDVDDFVNGDFHAKVEDDDECADDGISHESDGFYDRENAVLNYFGNRDRLYCSSSEREFNDAVDEDVDVHDDVILYAGDGNGDEDTGFEVAGFRLDEDAYVQDGAVTMYADDGDIWLEGAGFQVNEDNYVHNIEVPVYTGYCDCDGDDDNEFKGAEFRVKEDCNGAYVGLDLLDDIDDSDEEDDFYIDVKAEEFQSTDTWWDKDAVLLDAQCDKEDSIEQAWLVL